ncbi:DUF4382 domain-containing protein [Halomontanus rarus]|uniref:DUF4382 domain-containing protein n=1 Tax=Halomontanus rarus TaxID=3034020 RepID=UPI0023E78D81|nr:DUF4382 domain-containing protein [Halovivax sp. TS33]
MTKHVSRILIVAALVAVAGCVGAGGLSGELSGETGSEDTTETESTGETRAETGALTFYVSDEPNRIGDFEHLNVTVTKVGLKSTATSNESGNENESETENESATDAGAEADNEGADGNGDWNEYAIDNRTVDLTELQGANASALDVLEVPEGEYETVFIYVSETEGILIDGTEATVKLPSEKLQIQTPFAVEAGEEIDFVFDIAPHKAGKSGKYILKPVISQTGTSDEIEIRDVDEPSDHATGTGTNGDTDSSDGTSGEGNESQTDVPEAERNASEGDGDEQAQIATFAPVG